MATESIFQTVAGMVRDAVLDTEPTLPPLPAPGDVPAALAELGSAAQDVASAADLGDWLSSVADWDSALRDLAGAAYGSPDAVDALLARTLQSRAPRTAALLALAGVLTGAPPDGTPGVDWDRLRRLVTSADTFIDEAFWDALLGDLGLPGDGRRVAVLVALVLLAPQTIVALARGDLRIAALPPPTADAPGTWADFLTTTDRWVSLTLPIGDPTRPAPNPGTVYDLVSGIQPDLAATLAGYADRVAVVGGRRTDFEAWLALALAGDEWALDLGRHWVLRVVPGITAGFGRVEGDWHGAFRAFTTDPALVPGPSDPVELTISREVPGGAPDLLLGPPYDSRISLRDVVFFLRVREEHPVVEVGVRADGFALVVSNRWFRVFGITDTIWREGLRYDADVELAYVEGEGVRFNLSSTLSFQLVLEARLGSESLNVTLHSVRVAVPIDVAAGEARVRGELRLHASVQLSRHVLIVIDGPGAWGGTWKDPLGDPTADREYFGLLPPTGGGIELDFVVASGGGYLERRELPDGTERWGGALTLRVFEFRVTAFGIYETSPSGETSFLAILGVRFGLPGIQLGFGFAITGIGGIVGIDRRVDGDALRERLTSGAAGNVLFLEDPIKNAPTILGDAAAIFPAAEGTFVVGPTFQLTWVGFARLDVGLVLELPGPSKLLLMGSFQAEIRGTSPKKPLLSLRLDVVGLIDFEKVTVEFDATLIGSKALEVFHLTGDAAFRSCFAPGENKYVLLSIGGFRPGFDPSPVVVPALTRVALTQTPGFFEAGWHLRFEAYLAITSNTFQLGGQVEVGLTLGPLNATGFLAFDALVEFRPFYFEVAFSAGMRLRWRSTTLAGVRVTGMLAGPGPVRLRGEACLEILFFDICASGEIAIGSDAAPAAEPVGSVVRALAAEVHAAENLRAEDGDDRMVIAAEAESGLSDALVSPIGGLVWQQKRAPLDLLLERFEGVPLAAPQAVVATSPHERGRADEWFAPGSFLDLTDAEALNARSFQALQAGVRMGFGMRETTAVVRDVEVVTIRLPRRVPVLLTALSFPDVLVAATAGRTAAAAASPGVPRYAAEGEAWQVHAVVGGAVRSASSEADARQRAKHGDGVAVPAGDLVDLGEF